MKKLILITTLLSVGNCFALDPMQPVAQKIDGELRLVKSKIPNIWNGISNYRKAGEAKHIADGWVQVESSLVVTTNVIDRAVSDAEQFAKDSAKVTQGANALEVIDPLTNGKVALKAFQQLPQSAITASTKEKFDAGNASQKDEINSARIELINIILEALAEGKDWRDIDDSQFVTNVVTSTVWTEVVE